MICGAKDEVADRLRGPATAAAFEVTDSKDGDTNGPLSKVQPEAQPVAAGPTKVGV
jgi:hypothetical protein